MKNILFLILFFIAGQLAYGGDLLSGLDFPASAQKNILIAGTNAMKSETIGKMAFTMIEQ
ncbi:MAG: hypothetical protein AB9846_17600 [Tenuifilaceae bacterium]